MRSRIVLMQPARKWRVKQRARDVGDGDCAQHAPDKRHTVDKTCEEGVSPQAGKGLCDFQAEDRLGFRGYKMGAGITRNRELRL